MIKINLLPVRAAARMESARKHLSIAVLMLVLFSIVVASIHFRMQGKISELNSAVSNTEREIESLKSVIAKVNQFKKDKDVLNKKLSVIKDLNQSRIAPVHLMDELSRMLPEKLWLESLSESGWQIKMMGVGLSHDIIADFMTNMERSPMFDKVKLNSTSQQKKAGMSLLKFSIEASFVPPRPEEE